MTGVLGITGKFASGPDGDPAPMEVVDFDAELTTVGFGSLFSGGIVAKIGRPWLEGSLFRPDARRGHLPSTGQLHPASHGWRHSPFGRLDVLRLCRRFLLYQCASERCFKDL